jgi:hypothetical protein
MASHSGFFAVHEKLTGSGHLYNMRTASLVLPGLSLYRKGVEQGVSKNSPRLVAVTHENAGIVG